MDFSYYNFILGLFVECVVHLFNAIPCLNILVENSWRLWTGCLVLFSGRQHGFCFADINKSFKSELGMQVLWLVKKLPVVLGPRCDIHFLLIASLKKDGLGCSFGGKTLINLPILSSDVTLILSCCFQCIFLNLTKCKFSCLLLTM